MCHRHCVSAPMNKCLFLLTEPIGSVLYGICGSLNILIGLLSSGKNKNMAYYESSYSGRLFDAVIDAPFFLFELVKWFFESLPRIGAFLKRPLTRTRKYMTDRHTRAEAAKQTTSEQTQNTATYTEKHEPDVLFPAKIHTKTQSDESFIPVARGIHSADLETMSRAEFPSSNRDDAATQAWLDSAKEYACTGSLKAKCKLCNIQVCSVSLDHV